MSTDVGAANPNDQYLAQQWDMTHVTAPTAWANGFTGTDQLRVCRINPQEAAGAGASSTNGYKNGIDDDGDGEH